VALRAITDPRHRDAVINTFASLFASSREELTVCLFATQRVASLYRLLLLNGFPPLQCAAYGPPSASDRLAVEDFSGRKVVMVDDTVFVGTSLAHLKHALLDECSAASVQTLVIAISDDSAKGLTEYLELGLFDVSPNIEVERLSAEINAALVMNQVPAFVGFPEYVCKSALSSIIACTAHGSAWDMYDVGVAWSSGVFACYSLLPSEDTRSTIDTLFERVATNLSEAVAIVKVRLFAHFQGHHALTRIIPMVILVPMAAPQIDQLTSRLIELTSGTINRLEHIHKWNSARKAAFIQLCLSALVGEVFYSESPFAKDSYEQAFGCSPAQLAEFDDVELLAATHIVEAVWAADNNTHQVPALRLEDANEAIGIKRDDLDTFSRLASDLERFVDEVPRTPDRAPAYDQLSLANKVANIFGSYFDRYERYEEDILRTLEISELLEKYADRTARASNTGLTAGELFDLLGVESSQHEIASLALDVAVDFGIVIPQTIEDRTGTVFRVYSMGENARLFDSVHGAKRDLAYADAFTERTSIVS
jgi:hypothetical protein